MSISVLLVDDEADFASLLAMRLEAREFMVEVAGDGDEALRCLEVRDFDVAVLDIGLPGMSGLDLLVRLKERKPAIQAIMLTGQSSLATAIEGMKRGAFDYLLKPVDIEVLAEDIRQAADRKIGQEESLRMIETGKMAALGALAQGVAHEVNNPVNIMVQEAGWIEDLLDEEEFRACRNLPELRRSAVQIEVQGKRCKAITAKLQSLARRIDPRPQDVRLDKLLARLADEARERAAGLSVTVVTELSPDTPVISASPAELDQVFTNLIDNALDAMEAHGGTLRLACRPGRAPLLTAPAGKGDTEVAEVEVADTGHGISSANLPRIFEPFFSTKQVGKGTGLGLAICYGLIQSMGGEIEAHSVVGEGTEVAVRLPALSDEARSQGTRRASPLERSGEDPAGPLQPGAWGRSREIETGSIVVLLVHPDPEELAGLARRLENAGLAVIPVDRGRDAIRVLELSGELSGEMTGKSGGETGDRNLGNRVDILLLSLADPGPGRTPPLDILRQARARWALVPVILLMDQDQAEVCGRGLAAGAYDFVRSPLDLDELLPKVEESKLHKVRKEAKIRGLHSSS